MTLFSDMPILRCTRANLRTRRSASCAAAQRPRETLAQAAPSHRAADRPHEGGPSDGPMLVARHTRRCAACAELRGGLQHPLAAAGHRPPRPGRTHRRLLGCDHVPRLLAARHASTIAPTVIPNPCFGIRCAWMNSAGPTTYPSSN